MLIRSKAKKELYFSTLLGRIAPTLMKVAVSFAKKILLFGITGTSSTADTEIQKRKYTDRICLIKTK